MFNGFKWVWEECRWELANVKTFSNPGLILPGLRYLFAIFKLLSIGGWINRNYRYFTSQELKDSGYLYIFRRMDFYILLWIVLELLVTFLQHRSPQIFHEPWRIVVLGFASYRLFEIFQAWVCQFILTYKWDPINASRSLVIAFGGYWEVVVIGGIIRAVANQPGPLTNSITTMILNPANEGTSPIQYIQIMFVLLFIIVVAKQMVGKMSTVETDKE